MATIEPRKNKNGKIISYRVTVADGVDIHGNQIRRRKSWKPEKGMTEKQQEKALARFVTDFEREVEQGFQTDAGWKFADYAAYVIDLKERNGAKPKTIDRYNDLLVRISQAMGHKKLTEIRPQHLNDFYKNLGEKGVRLDGRHAIARIDLKALLKRRKLSRAKIAARSGLGASTVAAIVNGDSVRLQTAEAFAAALNLSMERTFTITSDDKTLSAKTIREYHQLIRTIFAQAEKEMLVQYNPAAKASPPKVPHKEPDCYQPEEMDDILDALDDAPLKWKALVYLLIDTGCRRGEACGCKWERLDLDTGVWDISTALLYSPKRGTYESTTKTGKTRKVSLNEETVWLLRKYKRAQAGLRLANGDRWIETGYVFTREDGTPIHPDSVTSWLDSFSKKNGLPHIHPHGFRHTAASNMIAGGLDLVTTANELGHANATTTATIYAHQIQTAKEKAKNVRANVFNHRKEA